MITKTLGSIKMGFWNVGGLISKTYEKTEDPIFLKKDREL